MQLFDIVINGNGLIGLALACGLNNSGLRIALIAKNSLEFFTNNSIFKFSTINTASKKLLIYLQIWDKIQDINPYKKIEIWDKDNFGQIIFDSDKTEYENLGYIIENSVLYNTLLQRAKNIKNITIITSTLIKKVIWDTYKVSIFLDNNQIIIAKLIIAADGAQSWLRQIANIPITFWDYQHHILITTINTELPHNNIVRQIFHSDGILTFLPLKQPNLSYIIWSFLPDITKNILLESNNINNIITMKSNSVLGLCNIQEKCNKNIIHGHYARNFAAHRLVLVGDAAHVISPLSGEGINIGFMNIADLINEIYYLNKNGKDIGNYEYLRPYERRCKQRATFILGSIYGLKKIFHGNNITKKLLRAIGLKLIDNIPNIKMYFIHQAMGLNDIPSWLVRISNSNICDRDSINW